MRPDGSPSMVKYGDGAAGQHELWPLLAEKGFAEISTNGSYNDINFGIGGQGLTAITGNRAALHLGMFTTIDDLARWSDEHRAIVAGTQLTANDDLFKNNILIPKHVYWVRKVDKANKKVTMGNPWGYDNRTAELTEAEFQRGFLEVYEVSVPQ